jgi:hypothetical protein
MAHDHNWDGSAFIAQGTHGHMQLSDWPGALVFRVHMDNGHLSPADSVTGAWQAKVDDHRVKVMTEVGTPGSVQISLGRGWDQVPEG